MISDKICRWIEGLGPRVTEYLYFNDRVDEAAGRLDLLEGDARTDYEMSLLGDFLAGNMYSADFEPEPDEGVRVETVDDLKALAETELDRKRLEKSVDRIFSPDAGKTGTGAPTGDPYRDDFFRMMKDAFGANELYNNIEGARTDAVSAIENYMQEEPADSEDPSSGKDEPQASGADDLMARIRDAVDGHIE